MNGADAVLRGIRHFGGTYDGTHRGRVAHMFVRRIDSLLGTNSMLPCCLRFDALLIYRRFIIRAGPDRYRAVAGIH